jgi:hypothetical protein
MKRPVQYDEGAKGMLLIALIAQLFLQNGVMLVFGGLLFAWIFYNLLQPGKPNVFTVIFIYHFIQVAAAVWFSNWNGVDVNFRTPSNTKAIITSYVGLWVLFMPIIYYQDKIPAISWSSLRRYADQLSIKKSFHAYAISFMATGGLIAIAFALPGFTQVIFSLVGLKWFFFLLFGMQVFLKNRMKKEFYLFAGFEFLSGFYSYFSDFKSVIFFILFLFFFFLRKIAFKNLVLTVTVGLLALIGMAFYSGIKGEYRAYLNQGSDKQVIKVGQVEALSKLVEIAQESDKNLDESISGFLDRFQYTFHLAKAMDLIPEKMDYQEGKNWGATLSFVLTPRLLNPDKPIYEASKKASKYTGIMYSGYEQGVSFSLGYFADGYVDFGIVGMMIPLAFIGFIYGASYFYFVRKSSPNYLFNVAVVGAMFMEFFAYEMDSTFLTGRLLTTLLTYTLLKHFFFPWLIKQLRAPTQISTSTETAASAPPLDLPLPAGT